jgi:uncharacterized DUF497 family protein
MKHGVSFQDAGSVIRDPLQIVTVDETHSDHEERLRVIGSTQDGRLLVVVVATSATGIIRLISARRPTRRERHAYEYGL